MLKSNFLPTNDNLINFDEGLVFCLGCPKYLQQVSDSEVLCAAYTAGPRMWAMSRASFTESKDLSTPGAADFKFRNTGSSRVYFLLKLINLCQCVAHCYLLHKTLPYSHTSPCYFSVFTLSSFFTASNLLAGPGPRITQISHMEAIPSL